MSEAREVLRDILGKDLVGPQHGPDEEIAARPTDQYMVGILFAQAEEVGEEEDDDKGSAENSDGSPGEAVSMASQRRPSSMGVSFALEGKAPRLRIVGEAARYIRKWKSADGKLTDAQGTREAERWLRHPVELACELPVEEGVKDHKGPEEGLQWCVRAIRGHGGPDRWQVTVILTNIGKAKEKGRAASEEATYLQVHFSVAPVSATLVARQSSRAVGDLDTASNELIYRHQREWAVGHNCGATWASEDQTCSSVATTWMPEQRVRSMNESGHEVFRKVAREKLGDELKAFNAQALAQASKQELLESLAVIPTAYREWLATQESEVDKLSRRGELTSQMHNTAMRHLDTGKEACSRIEAGIKTIATDDKAMRAFQLAQGAMAMQRNWAEGKSLVWRPFQLGFQLLALAGLAEPTDKNGKVSADRQSMDLLWFPTGGGKTEAYLALIAFVLFHRRLRSAPTPDAGSGTAVLMRYTLRLLTVQQFERASRLVTACEWIRRDLQKKKDSSLGKEPFSIGLWVGSDATPNKLEAARGKDAAKAKQLVRCPACNGEGTLLWDYARTNKTSPYLVRCDAATCPTAGWDLPVWTIDEEIYRVRPSLLIGTIDKFAQIVRNESTVQIFGARQVPPPELIIQDELHLITGPLGTLAGIYESAIDQICTWKGVPPKIIGSTATIRRAEDQVRALFNRSVLQFPPPVLDWSDSCFAVVDNNKPGRLYVGVSTAGRSPKFVLQAVCASLMQGASELPEPDRDPYWTLVAYFNSLRELGGALVMMFDDVLDSIGIYAEHHGRKVQERVLKEEPMELTSRVSSEEIPEFLKRLEQPYPKQEVAVVLATNMLSVGVDIPRLGLMVVNGQPKSMAEYIQASSRVGRNTVAGLIVTVYNAGRPRDRSHFEAFKTWHQSLYREVEASSVTPFAPRARDRALHAAIVAIARHLVSSLRSTPALDEKSRKELQRYVDILIGRATDVDKDEAADTSAEASRILDGWMGRRGVVAEYWNDWKEATSLLVSSEKVADHKARFGAWAKAALPTPNSMREVEPSSQAVIVPGLRPTQNPGPGAAPPTATPRPAAGARRQTARRGGRR